jgi:hypothetical protein
MAKDSRLKGWIMLDDERVQFFNYVGGAVLPTEYVIAVALRYVQTQEQLDAVRRGEQRWDQIQIGLNSEQARLLADHLLKAADLMERGAPPPEKRN